MRSFDLKPVNFFKWTFTAALAAGMLFLIVSDYSKLKQKYPGNAFFSYIFTERERVKAKAKLINLNQAVPHYYANLFRVANGEPEFESPDSLPTYTRYYKMITEYMPHLSEGYGLLAFCYYYDRKITEAVDLYEKAIILNPHVVWFYYNLGVIHYKEKQYAQAINAFQRALNVDVSLSIKFVLSSKLYQDILRERALGAADIEKGIREIQQNSEVLLKLSAFHLRKSGAQETALSDVSLHLKIF